MAFPAITGSWTTRDILQAPFLTQIAHIFRDGIIDPLPPAIYEVGKKDRSEDNTARVPLLFGQRQTSKLSAYGAESTSVEPLPMGLRDINMLSVSEDIPFYGADFTNLFKPDQLAEDNLGLEEILRQVKGLVERDKNLRIAATVQVLFQGLLYFDKQGNLLPNSTNNATNVQYQIPNGTSTNSVPVTPWSNLYGNQIGRSIDPFDTGTPIAGGAAGSWALSSTAIDQQMMAIEKASAQLTGFELDTALFGQNIPHYLRTNSTSEYFMARTPKYNPDMIDKIQEVPSGLFGINNWIDCSRAYYLDQNGTYQQLVGNDQLVLIPKIGPEWWRFFEGCDVSLKGPGTVFDGSAEKWHEQFQKEYGLFTYADMMTNPVGARVIMKDTFLPAICNPQVIFIMTVV